MYPDICKEMYTNIFLPVIDPMPGKAEYHKCVFYCRIKELMQQKSQ